MKKEYDFSKAERGRFYRADAHLNLPVYLQEEVQRLVVRIARRRRSDISTVVNEFLKSDPRLAKALE